MVWRRVSPHAARANFLKLVAASAVAWTASARYERGRQTEPHGVTAGASGKVYLDAAISTWLWIREWLSRR
jgi:hypothetical protein